ncbi:MAG TPA: GNAT family N-acetyltransferase [Longimicrobium sp.]|nr:GNAT family N-acetyltransferase [Longimicrobium sp.]
MADELRVVEVRDERTQLARDAVELLQVAIGDVQPAADLLSEIEEGRRGLPSGGDYHLLVALDADGEPAAAAAGVYLEGVNAGFITYLAVRPDVRNQQLGRKLRAHLLECFHEDARLAHGAELAWTVGEVRRESAWLHTLVHGGRAITFDLGYFHPWMPLRAEGRYVLYREPAADTRAEIPSHEVARLLFAIWRRAYRIRYPLQSETFCYMLRGLEGRETIGADPGFASTAG